MADTPKNNELTRAAEKRDETVKDIPAHKGEQVTTRDTTPAVERPGHDTEHPDRPAM